MTGADFPTPVQMWGINSPCNYGFKSNIFPKVNIKICSSHFKYGGWLAGGAGKVHITGTDHPRPLVLCNFNVVLMTKCIAGNFKALKIFSRLLTYIFQSSCSHDLTVNILAMELDVLIIVKHLQEKLFLVSVH